MSKSTRKRSGGKPDKPYPDFPLFPHASGRWAKKIRGKHHYFGPWDDPDGALQRYLDQRDALHAGRLPRVPGGGLTVRDLVNRFLTSKKVFLDAGEIAPRTWKDYYASCERIIQAFGKTRLVDDLASDDFEQLRATMSETMGPNFLKVEITRVKSVFKYAFDSGLLDRPVRYGPTFKVPSKRVLQKARSAAGLRMFEAAEIRTMIEAASPQLKAMILLGVNCGFGNHDVATLPLSALDLENGWVEHPRPKTGVERRCPLWPETVAAIREAISIRPEPKTPANADLVFLTRQHRNRWVRLVGNSWSDAICNAMRELLTELGLKRPGRNFYALRHTFETIGGESIDQVAVDHVMGHDRGDMASVYRERISDERLIAVTNHVREWLFGDHSGAGTRPAIGQS